MSERGDAIPMSDTVSYSVTDRIACLAISNPPVNGLGLSVREGLAAALDKAFADADVASVIIHGRGSMFCGGADIRQFNTPAASSHPLTRDILKKIEEARKPVIAAIHGFALGGGLEFALGCHYRVIQTSAKIGLPEVKLGLIPGGGGTQRLPRLVGLQAAIDIILTGKHVAAAKALKLGIVDRIAEGDVLAAACQFAREMRQSATLPLVAHMPAPADTDSVLEREKSRLAANKRAGAAERAAIACIEAASALPFDDGVALERSTFIELVEGNESKAMRHLFFGEREALKVPGVTGVATPRPVNSVGIVGAGTMGAGIAMAFANAGIPVILIDQGDVRLDRGVSAIQKNYEITASKGKLSTDDVKARMSLIRPTTDLGRLGQCDLVVEAIFEDMTAKLEMFRQLDAICKPEAVIATNTSRLDVNDIAAATRRPESVIGLHFFSPANVMRLLEIVRAEKTAPWALQTSLAVANKIGKTPVVVGVCEGFVGNRMLTAYWREAGFLLEEGASPRQIDQALQNFGMAMGPLAMADLAGMDINWATRKRLAPMRPKNLRYSKVADRICEVGRFGQKTGAGYYRYETGSRTPNPDPIVDEIIENCAREAGITRRMISDQEIVDRTIFALVNEGAYILEDRIAQRASDIDVVYVNGYGFPAFRGGPMFYADSVGPDRVLKQIQEWRATQGEHWKPSKLFGAMVERKGRFSA
jgi:3-hydroxyacyl-CoA dehydrogenase